MSLKDSLRKAAEYFVDMPEGEGEAGAETRQDTPEHSDSGAAHLAPGDAGAMDDIDRRLAAMTQRMAGLQSQEPEAPVAATAPAASDGTSATDGGAAVLPPSADSATTAGTDLLNASGELDVARLYSDAGVPGVPFSAEQTLEMIQSLPGTMPADVKRQTVQVAVASMGKAIGATPEAIVGDAERKRAALAAYAEGVSKQTNDFAAAAEFEIAELTRQIEEKRAAVRDARSRQAHVKERCDAEAARLAELLQFLGDSH